MDTVVHPGPRGTCSLGPGIGDRAPESGAWAEATRRPREAAAARPANLERAERIALGSAVTKRLHDKALRSLREVTAGLEARQRVGTRVRVAPPGPAAPIELEHQHRREPVAATHRMIAQHDMIGARGHDAAAPQAWGAKGGETEGRAGRSGKHRLCRWTNPEIDPENLELERRASNPPGPPRSNQPPAVLLQSAASVTADSERFETMGGAPEGDSLEFERVAASAAKALFGDGPEPTPTVGRFELGRRLGSGAMGTVYEAYDPELDRHVALKVVSRLARPPEGQTDAPTKRGGDGGDGGTEAGNEAPQPEPTPASRGTQTELLAEARAAARVEHPNVVKVFESGLHRGRIFIAMQLVDGVDLQTWLRLERPAWPQVLAVFARIARGLAAVHAAGIVHRDFKPANVLITRVDDRPQPQVVDFGLAAETTALRTRRGGTLGYMPLEQLEGAPLDTRADQFAFFVTLHQALGAGPPPPPTAAEHRPRDGGGGPSTAPQWSDDARRAWLASAKGRPGPRALGRWIAKGTHPDPEQRFADMNAVADALEQVPKTRGRRRALAATGVALALGGIGLTAALHDPCADAGGEWAQTYDEERRDALRQSFEDAAPAYARQGFEAVDALFERFGAAWTQTSRQACVADPPRMISLPARRDRAEGGRGDGDGDGVTSCLDKRLVEAQAVLEQLGELDPTTAPEAATAVANLPDPARCLDPSQRAITGEPPEGSVEALAQAATHLTLGELAQAEDALARADALLAEVDGDADEGSTTTTVPDVQRVELAVLGAVLADRRGDPEAAHAALREAFHDAVALGLDALAARAATELVWTTGYKLLDREDAQQWAEIGAAFETRANLGPHATASRLDRFASVLDRAGEYEQALKVRTEALELARRAWGDGSPLLFPFLAHLGGTAARVPGEADKASEYNKRALALAESVYGPDHPTVALALTNRPVPLEPEPCRKALPDIERALAIKVRAFGEGSSKLTPTLNKLGNCQGVLGDHAAAIETLERAVEIVGKTSGPTDPRIAIYSVNIARSLMERGDDDSLDDAEVALERALEVDRARLGDDHWELLYALVGLLDVDLRYRERTDDVTATRLEQADRIFALGQCADPTLALLLQLDHVRHAVLEGRAAEAEQWLDTARATIEREGIDSETNADALASVATLVETQ